MLGIVGQWRADKVVLMVLAVGMKVDGRFERSSLRISFSRGGSSLPVHQLLHRFARSRLTWMLWAKRTD